jgi:Flp pilus assembly protein TadD
MKNKKREHSKTAAAAALALSPGKPSWPVWAGLGAALIAVWWAYSPSMQAPFLFDDTILPFAHPYTRDTFTIWWGGIRPVLMATYLMSARLSSGDDTFAYHAIGVLIHFITSGLVFLIARRLLEWSGAPPQRRDLLAAFGAGLFLLHPAQTEAVAYIAGRSEALSVCFAYAAFAVFVRRRSPAVTWGTAAAILILFGLGVLSKEHIVVLPAWLLLTDFWWNPGAPIKAIRANWKVYAPIAVGAIAGAGMAARVLFYSESAGFNIKGLTWYQYLFTQFRALFVYVATFIAPVHLTADWEFPISRTILDHGSVFGLIALVVLIAGAWLYRRRFPLATYGILVYLLLMAPTSSVLPIKDPVAERRLYFSMIGLLLVAIDLLGRVKLRERSLAAICAGILIVAATGTRARAEVWSDPVLLWQDTIRKSPTNVRARKQLAQSYFDEQQYQRAVETYEQLRALQPPDYETLVNSGLAYQRMNRLDLALAQFNEAAKLDPTAHVYSQIGMIEAQLGRRAEALEALGKAEKLDPSWAATFNYRAKVHFQANELAEAVADYRRALALQPSLTDAREELTRAEAMLRASGGK